MKNDYNQGPHVNQQNIADPSPVIWARLMDNTFEGRTLGLNLTFWLRENNNHRWDITSFGDGVELTRSFDYPAQARAWAEQRCRSNDDCLPVASV